ncbi:signal peptidase I [Robertmurraya sp. P23]|uniref:signal peptidase I n=1 Tax=Robertmurraya sp. P23 TaxID=3436931 RepID=UPI003D951B0F
MRFDSDTVSLLQKTIQKDGWLDLPSQGYSMYPTIQNGDLCRFVPCSGNQLKKGDVILFWSETGQLIAHRFYYSKVRDGKLQYFCKGDTNIGFDQPIEYENILGTLKYIDKGNRKVFPNQLRIHLWGRLIMNHPILTDFLRRYLNRKSVFL